MGDSFRTKIDWHHMVGGQFVGHPRDFRDYHVDICQPDHEICRGLEPFKLHSEQYYMQTDPRINVPATTTFHDTGLPECDGVTIPNVWTTNYGKGRVFYSAFGHRPSDFAHPQVRCLFERGALWAASGHT